MHKNKSLRYKKKNSVQPVFYHQSDKENEIKAGGVVFYFYDKKKHELKFLMIKNRNKYEDFGGKTDKKDSCIEETISREVEEESNSIFSQSKTLERIKKKQPLYTPNSKYLLYFCRLKKSEHFNPIIFGDKEIYENIPRTVEWVSYNQLKNSKFIKENLSYRLRFKHFFEKINTLNEFYKIKYPKQIEPEVNSASV